MRDGSDGKTLTAGKMEVRSREKPRQYMYCMYSKGASLF